TLHMVCGDLIEYLKPDYLKMLETHLLIKTLQWAFTGIHLLMLLLMSPPDLWATTSPPKDKQVMGIMAKMEAAYAHITEYQTETEVSEYRDGQASETKRFRYTFMKPNHLRIDMESPKSGMILVYPDDDGKVFVKPGG